MCWKVQYNLRKNALVTIDFFLIYIMKGEDKRLEAFLTSPPVQSGVISIRVYRGKVQLRKSLMVLFKWNNHKITAFPGSVKLE